MQVQQLQYVTIGDFIVNMKEVRYIKKTSDGVYIHCINGDRLYAKLSEKELKQLFTPIVTYTDKPYYGGDMLL